MQDVFVTCPMSCLVTLVATFAGQTTPRGVDATREGGDVLRGVFPTFPIEYWAACAQALERMKFLGYDPVFKRRHVLPSAEQVAVSALGHLAQTAGMPAPSITEFYPVKEVLAHYARHCRGEFDSWQAARLAEEQQAAELAQSFGFVPAPSAQVQAQV